VILSDGEIRDSLVAQEIVFDPPLSDEYLATALTTSALDLRLGNELHFYKSLEEAFPSALADVPAIDPSRPGGISDLIQKCAVHESIAGSHHDLLPQRFALGATLERIHLPEASCLAARVEGKSGLARLGFVVHMTAPTIHCGFNGNIVLEILNFGPYPIRLTPGMPICQLIFERLGREPMLGQTTQFQGQTGATS
jgi:dCTP deaminase